MSKKRVPPVKRISPNYREIYNEVLTRDGRDPLAENSLGLQAVIDSQNRLNMLSGRALDVGCGVGFVVEYLSKSNFDLVPFGVDVSDVAIEKATHRLNQVPGSAQRLIAIEDQHLPFENDFFTLVTCLDMLEHLEAADIDTTLFEMQRVLRKGGVMMLSVACRNSGMLDKYGENLHRTVKSVDWWLDRVEPDEAHFDGLGKQLTLWKHVRLTDVPTRDVVKTEKRVKLDGVMPSEKQTPDDTDLLESHPKDSASLYQRIYDENPWYGNAEQGRCPGVRLLPEYQEWLLSPVIDLGCGRGQTVEKLREEGFEADGIDQISNHPDMRVGDITKPIQDIEKFQSAVCIDCIEHLYEDQVLGLFENMKRVKRQAFSIHNGPSTGTGQELHVNRKSFIDWTKLVRDHFDIASAIQISEEQILYLTQTKQDA